MGQVEEWGLVEAAESAGFDVMVTSDQNLTYQQNLKGRKIALIVLGNGNWPVIQDHLAKIAAAVDAAKPGSYQFIEMPLPPKRKYKAKTRCVICLNGLDGVKENIGPVSAISLPESFAIASSISRSSWP